MSETTMQPTLKVSLPTLRNISEGIRASFMLISLQWGLNRSLKSRLMLSAILTGIAGAIFAVSQVGWLVKYIAMDDPESVASQLATTWLFSFTRGEMGTIGATALGICILSSLMSPLTGATSTSFTPPKEMAGLSVIRWQRFIDSIVAQVISSISLLQLIILTALTSMITLDNDAKAGALVLTWTIWLGLIALTNLTLWFSEYINRRFGALTRRIIIFSMTFMVLLAVYLDPNNGSTVFGIGNLYAENVANIGNGDPLTQIANIGLVAMIALVVIYASSVMSSIALSLPESTAIKKEKAYTGKFAFQNPSLFSVFINAMMRTRDIRKPIISAVIIGIIIVTLAPKMYSVNTTFAIIIPLVIALSWGANAFGVLGGGATWLKTQPRILNRAPWAIYWIQVLGSVFLFTVIWFAVIVSGRSDFENAAANFLAMFAVSVLTARSATSKSINSPAPMRFGSRGESSLAPSKALEYTARFSLWSGVYGIIVLSIEDLKTQLVLAFAAFAWSIFRMIFLQEKYTKPNVQSKILATVVTD